jgi:DNA-binding NtrC family response regulator
MGVTNILHVDTDPSARALVKQAVERLGESAELIAADTLRGALAVLRGTPIACVVSELALSDATGLRVLEALVEAQPTTQLIALTAMHRLAVHRMGFDSVTVVPKDGATPDVLAQSIGDALGYAVLAETSGSDRIADGPAYARFGGCDFIARTLVMRQVLDLVATAAESSVPVLIEGETGTGKEILARALHARSPRRGAPFVVQNCGALAETVLESELFGHVRGAFTGAERDRPGLFLEAADGTVFLDEIGEAPPSVQARLLRVLQHGEVKPVGSDRVQRVTARIVAATNRPLAERVQRNAFRADLFYRLNVFPVHVPPLRQRLADVEPLLDHFLTRFQREERRDGFSVAPDAIAVLCAYSWPGNVRELEHEVHRWTLAHPSGTRIQTGHVAAHIRRHGASVANEPLDELLARVERVLIRQRLDRFTTKTEAARSLGITREALYLKLRRLGVCEPRERTVGEPRG